MENLKKRICVFAGMPRAGTTFMYYNLMKHPSVFLPYRKELDYFSLFYDRGEEWYLKHFKAMGKEQRTKNKEQVAFDISPSYFLSREAAERIKGSRPGAIVNHDSRIGNNTFLSPNYTVCGCVEILGQSFIGAGSVIVDHVTLPKGTFVKAGSVFTGR